MDNIKCNFIKCNFIVLTFLAQFGNIRAKALLYNEHFRTFVLSLRLSRFCFRGHRKESQSLITGCSVVFMLPYNSLILSKLFQICRYNSYRKVLHVVNIAV